MQVEELLAAAHAAHAERRFAEADDAFRQAAETATLTAEDYLAWSDAAWWLGHADRCLELSEIAHRLLMDRGDRRRAAKEGLGLGFLLMLRGDLAAGSGWIQRSRSILAGASDSPEHGYLVHLDAEEALERRDLGTAIDLARQAQDVGRQSADPSLVSLALMTQGTAMIRRGEVREGMAVLDEAMLGVQAGQVTAEFAGNLYCQMIAICWELADLDRAREWTDITDRWCEGFDSALMFSGICRMHRVQLRQVAGDWDTAIAEAKRVCTELVDMNTAVVAEGHYLLADLLRLRGATSEAEAAYRRAHELGRDPQPGLARLRAEQGDVGRALTSLRSALTATEPGQPSRAPLLGAMVELAIAADALDDAAAARDELVDLASTFRTNGLLAIASQTNGAVELARGDPAAAVTSLRDGVRRWQELGGRYEGARARSQLARAYLELGDEESARLEIDAATRVFEQLDATVDLRALVSAGTKVDHPSELTPRETEVLTRVAGGGTNRDVAEQLFISERTVARHLANIYLKLGVSTRTAAVAWARSRGFV